jgi:hypothetical protein
MELKKASSGPGRPKRYFFETLSVNDHFPVTKGSRGSIKTNANKWGRLQEPVREFDIYTDGVQFFLKRIQ